VPPGPNATVTAANCPHCAVNQIGPGRVINTTRPSIVDSMVHRGPSCAASGIEISVIYRIAAIQAAVTGGIVDSATQFSEKYSNSMKELPESERICTIRLAVLHCTVMFQADGRHCYTGNALSSTDVRTRHKD